MSERQDRAHVFFTTAEVAEYCAVTNDGVLKWIKSGKLRAFATPGGHYRIAMDDFKEFLKKYDIPLNEEIFRKKVAERHPRSKILYVCEYLDRNQLLGMLTLLFGEEIVRAATTGNDALFLAGEHKPGVIFIDATRVSTTTLALCDTLRQHLPKCAIICMTPSAESHADLYESGASEVYLKLDQPQLRKIADRLMAS